jgi:hypothetical protein
LGNGSVSFSAKVPFESVTINKIKTRTLKSSINGSKQYFTSDAQGILLHRLFVPRINIPGVGIKSVTLTASPAIVLATEGAEIGQTFNSYGNFNAVIPGIGAGLLPYSASYTVLGYETATVPAGTFETIKLQGAIYQNGDLSTAVTYYLAKNIGIVKQETVASGSTTVSELQETSVGIHDLAVTAITPPSKITLTAKASAITKTVKVTIQNRGPLLETIADIDTLQKFVDLKIESIGNCPAPIVQLMTDKIQKRLPISLKPKEILAVDYAVTFNCANDSQANTPKSAGHEDYRYTAKVDRSVLDGKSDVHQDDDVCPRNATTPYKVDTLKIKDRGCGAKKPDKTFGADMITDVVGL